MVNTIIRILLFLCVCVFGNGYESKAFGWQFFGISNTVVIEFTDEHDLLNQLRSVEVGQKIELRQKNQGVPTPTGIRCNDTAAKSAYLNELERINREINLELKRIQPPSVQ